MVNLFSIPKILVQCTKQQRSFYLQEEWAKKLPNCSWNFLALAMGSLCIGIGIIIPRKKFWFLRTSWLIAWVWDSQSAELCSKGLFFKKVWINTSAQSKINAGTCPTFLPSMSWSSGSVWSGLLICFWSIILSLMSVYSHMELMFLNLNFLMEQSRASTDFCILLNAQEQISEFWINNPSKVETFSQYRTSQYCTTVFVGMTNSTFPDHWAGDALVFNAGQCHDWVLPLLLKLKLWASKILCSFEETIFHPASGADAVCGE